MTFKNISENAVINAAGRLLDPGMKVGMKVEYYDKHKDFVDAYVTKKVGEITGLDEYEDFIKNGSKPVKKEKKVDLMEEVRAEEEAKAKEVEVKEPVVEEVKPEPTPEPEPKVEVKAEPEVEATPVVEEKVEEAPKKDETPKKKPAPRRKRAAKKTDEA